MQVLEIVVIVIIGIAAVSGAIILILRDMRGKGTCSAGACSSCTLAGRCVNENGSDSCRIPVKRK